MNTTKDNHLVAGLRKTILIVLAISLTCGLTPALSYADEVNSDYEVLEQIDSTEEEPLINELELPDSNLEEPLIDDNVIPDPGLEEPAYEEYSPNENEDGLSLEAAGDKFTVGTIIYEVLRPESAYAVTAKGVTSGTTKVSIPSTVKNPKDNKTYTVMNVTLSSIGLTSLDVSGCPELTFLRCAGNKLTTLDVSKNSKLTFLDCAGNQLTSLNVTKNPVLGELFCGGNKLTNLDVTNNPALKKLSVEENQFSSINLSKNTALTDFNCYSNKMTSLDVSKNTALINLLCNRNQISVLDITKNTALYNINCGENKLSSLNVTKNPNLSILYFYNNQLTSIDVSKNTKLTKVYCIRNKLTSLNLSNSTSLSTLNCAYNNLTSLIIPKTNTLTRIECASNSISSLDVSGRAGLNYLDCSLNKLSSLKFSNTPALQELYCGDNKLTSLDVSKNTALKKLRCLDNRLTSLDISKNTALVELYSYHNYIDNTKAHETWLAKSTSTGQVLPQRKVREVAGDTRLHTAVANANLAYPSGCSTVIIATSGSFADSLCAAPLAGALDAPILLTDKDELNSVVTEAIKKLKPSNIIIIGSETVVSARVKNSLESLIGKEVTRIYGNDRIETQIEIFKYGKGKNLWKGEVIVTTANNFADALSISPYAAYAKAPLFIVGNSGSMTQAQKDLISGYCAAGSRVLVLGDETVVPKSTENYFTGTLGAKVERLAGGINNSYSKSRYGTSAAIAKFCLSNGLSAQCVAFGTGSNFPDALVAGPTQAKLKGIVILTDATSDSAGFDGVNMLAGNAYKNCFEIRFLGNTNVLSSAHRERIIDMLW